VELLVDPKTTRLELGGIDVANSIFGLRVRADGAERTVYEPSEVFSVLVMIGAAAEAKEKVEAYREVQPDAVKTIEKLARAFGRANPVCTSDDQLTSIFSHYTWEKIERRLLEADVVRAEFRSTKGPKKTFLRRQVNIDELMQGLRRDATVPSSVFRFWNEIERDFPTKGSH
jgi:hypothetical protein